MRGRVHAISTLKGLVADLRVKIKVTLTPTKPLGNSFRMILVDKDQKPIAPFALMTMPKKAGETLTVETNVPIALLAQTSMLLFDAR